MTMGINAKTTRNRKVLYWMSTLLAALAFAAVGTADLVHIPKIVEGLVHLGYPAYFATILGMWQLLGSAAIIVPGLPRLKEWTYAGMFFTLTGASLSHAAVGEPLEKILLPIVLLVAVVTSWVLQRTRGSGARRRAQTQHLAAWVVRDKSRRVDDITSSLVHKS